MRQRIENKVLLTCTDVDLNSLSNLEVYIRQGHLFFQYVPAVQSSTEMIVTIPYDDAMKLKNDKVKIQFAFTDADGNHDASVIKEASVDALLKEGGYDPA